MRIHRWSLRPAGCRALRAPSRRYVRAALNNASAPARAGWSPAGGPDRSEPGRHGPTPVRDLRWIPVSRGPVLWLLVGGCAGDGQPARRQRQLVSLRCAGRDRVTVSGRELPHTRIGSRDHTDLFEGSRGGRRRPPDPSRCWCRGSDSLRLLAYGGLDPAALDESAQLARDSGCSNGRALPGSERKARWR